jgi:hypothetical protein
MSLLCLVALLGNPLFQPLSVFAKTAATGQLSFAKQVSVNGKQTPPGQTLFNGDRIRVSGAGTAVLNLGKLGRIELGKDTEFVLSISDDTIGGELLSGCLGILASGGTNTSVKTLKGVVSSDGAQPDSYFVGQRGNQGRVIPSLGEARMWIDGKMETIVPGESIDIDSPNGQNLLYRRTASSCTTALTCACNLMTDPSSTKNSNESSSNTAAQNNGSQSGNSGNSGNRNGSAFIPVLFSAVIGASMAAFLYNSPGPVVRPNRLTCVNSTGFFCRQLSPTSPNN